MAGAVSNESAATAAASVRTSNDIGKKYLPE
jgi:hypothetical protein